MIKKRWVASFLFIVFAMTVVAQNTTELHVLDIKNKQPLKGAEIRYSSSPDLKNARHTISDMNGNAILSHDDESCYYQIRLVGYLSAKGKIDSKVSKMTVYMKDKVIGVNEVIVTGSRVPRPFKTSPVTTQVMSGEALVNSGYADLQGALLQETAGLSIQRVEFGNEINMEGLDARHVLFLFDGEPMTGDIAGNLDYERFNIHALDHIEIVKGGSSALYGANSSGAVINLITKKTVKHLSVDAGIRYGEMNQRNFNHPGKKDFNYIFEKDADCPNLQSWVSVGCKNGAFTSQTDVLYAETDAFYLYQKKHDYKLYTREANPFLKKDTTLVSSLARPPMGVEGKEHILASQNLYFEPAKNFKMQMDWNVFFMNVYDLVQDFTFTQDKDFMGGIKATYWCKNWFSLTADLHGDFYNQYERSELRDERAQVYKSHIVQPQLTITSNYFSKHGLTFGVKSFTDVLISNRFVNRKWTSRSLNEKECLLQDEWTIDKQWMVTAGTRTDFSTQFGFMNMPKLAVKYSPCSEWSFRLNCAKGYRSPSIKELFYNWDHFGMFQVKGNEYLKLERNYYISLGSEYSGNRFYVNGTLYSNSFHNKIEGVWKIYDMQYNFEYTNLNYQRLLGCDFMARLMISDNWSSNMTFSYVDISRENGRHINEASPLAATGGIRYGFHHKDYTLTAELTSSVNGRKKFDVQDRLTVNGVSHEAYFRCVLPAYALCNLTVSQTFHNKIKLMAGVDNLFNYKPKTIGSGLTAFNIPATPGARCWIQLDFNIDNMIKF